MGAAYSNLVRASSLDESDNFLRMKTQTAKPNLISFTDRTASNLHVEKQTQKM